MTKTENSEQRTVDRGRLRGWLWLGLAFALAVLVASCGPRTAYAQAPQPGIYYAPGVDLEALDVATIHSVPPGGSINMATYALTDKAVIDALADRARTGVKVRIYRDHGEVAAECRSDPTCAAAPWHELLGIPGVEIRVKRSMVLMHLKAYILSYQDNLNRFDFLLREGSANFSPAGEKKQDNSALFTTDGAETLRFAVVFRQIWDRIDNLTVAEAVTGAPKKWGRRTAGAKADLGGAADAINQELAAGERFGP